MAYEITFPRLGWDMVEGNMGSWLKKDGEFVNAGEMLFSVEGDKAIQEIEALDSGYLRLLPNGPQTGDKLAVGALLGYLVPEAELSGFTIPGEPAPEPQAVTESKPVSAAPEPEVPAHSTQPAGDGRSRRIYISPYARRLAHSLGVNWQSVKGSGLAGRIMAKDVEASATAHKPAIATTPSQAPAVPVLSAVSETHMAMTQVRHKIAEHMAHSAHTAAPVTLTTEVNASELVAIRKALKEDAATSGQPAPSYNDLLARLCATALVEHPLVNARIEGDEIVQSSAVHIAIAVDTERGLMVPVLREVQSKTLRQIARESAALIEKTRSGAIGYAELQGATFTITNLGMYEIDAFTPIIDLPQCAILGVGRIMAKQVVIDAEAETVAIQQRMALSLTFDHRLIDGAQAARFLQRIKKLIETPYLWMAG